MSIKSRIPLKYRQREKILAIEILHFFSSNQIMGLTEERHKGAPMGRNFERSERDGCAEKDIRERLTI